MDVFLANGAVTLREEQRGQLYPFQERNLLLRNPGASKGPFQDVSNRAGAVFAELGVSRGAAFGDIDNDGDVDILVNVNNGPARLFRNDLPRRNWIGVQIDGPRLGWGTRVEVKAAGLPTQTRWVRTDSSYLSASDTRLYFGLGDSARIESLTVQAPGVPSQRFTGGQVKINSLFRVPAASTAPRP